MKGSNLAPQKGEEEEEDEERRGEEEEEGEETNLCLAVTLTYWREETAKARGWKIQGQPR